MIASASTEGKLISYAFAHEQTTRHHLPPRSLPTVELTRDRPARSGVQITILRKEAAVEAVAFACTREKHASEA